MPFPMENQIPKRKLKPRKEELEGDKCKLEASIEELTLRKKKLAHKKTAVAATA